MFTRRQAIAVFSAAVSGTAIAMSARAQANSPEQLIGELGIELLDMLKLEARTEREQRFRQLVARGVDVDILALFVLGRYRSELKPEQRAEYRKLFEQFLVSTYTSRLGLFKGETFAIRSTQTLNDTESLVQTHVERPERKPIRLDWRLRQRNGRWLIIDVLVEGISMAVTQRDEFAAVISNGGSVEALLNRLRQQQSS